MNPDPDPLASENSDQMIRFSLFRFLGGKKGSSICPEKATENFIQMVSACTIAAMSYVVDMSSDVMWNTQPIISSILSNNTQLETGN